MKKNKTTFLGGLILMVCCLAVAGLSYAQNGQWGRWCYKDYSSSGTFTVPSHCTKITVEAIGGGGGGGKAINPDYFWGVGSNYVHYSTGGGGGGGAYARLDEYAITSGTLNITVGTGGGSDNPGGYSEVKLSSGTVLIHANGGAQGNSAKNGGGSGGNGGTHSGYSGYTGAVGAVGSAGVHQNGGGGADNANANTGGAGGSCGKLSGTNPLGGDWICNNPSGAGGATTTGSDDWSEGHQGNPYGGGGSGGRTQRVGGGFGRGDKDGGSGANGFVRVWFYIESSTPLTLTVGTTSTSCPYTLTANATNELFTKNYKWSTGATSTSINVSPSANTPYTVTVTDKYSDATSGCQIESINSISVNGCSDCGVTIASATASPSEICVGGSSELSATLESPDASATYAWSINGSNAGSGNSLSYSVTPTSTTTYTIKVTVTKGSCTATDERTVKVTVNNKVTPTFASLFNDGYCMGTLPAISSLPTTSDNSITGTWAVSISGSNATYTFTPTTGQCANTFSKKVTISDNPTPGAIQPNIVVCNGTTTYTFNNATSAAGGINGQYAWQVSLDQSTWIDIPGANADSYTPMLDLSVIATALGVSTPTGTFYYRRAWVNDCEIKYSNVLSLDNPGTLAPGSISVTGKDAGAYCANATVTATLTANPEATVASPTFTYQWQSSTDGSTWTNISGATASSYNVNLNPVQKISYRYQVKYSTCDWMTSNNTYDITVKPLPVVLIEGANPYNVTKCANEEITVTVTGAGSYEWENHSTANPATFPASSDGSYVVTGTTDGCSSTATITITNNPLPTISATNATQNITYGASIADVVITNTNSVVELSTLPSWMSYNTSTQTLSGKPTAQGTYTVTATATSNTTPACGTATQEIKITVGKKNLTVTYTGTDGDNTKVYDGYPLTLSYDKLTFTGLESTDHITSGVITTDGYKVGDYICNAGSFGRMWATGTATPSGFGPASVTQNYTVTFNVTLSITKRPLEITANSASKEYDATPLTDDGWTYTNGTSLASTDEATVIVTGSQLCPGSSPNVVGAVSIKHTSDNEDVTDCYTITKKNGTLTVTPMACPATKTFEGYDYPLVQVGNKCWFAENLRAAATDAVPYDNQSANTAKFGLLYNWSAALAGNGAIKTDPCNGKFVQGICPSGWAIPSAADFNELQTIASGVINLRSDDATYWLPEYLGTDAVNFDERGGGLFNATLNRFEELKTAAYFWTSESVLHAASFPDGVAHTYCDEYYCGEYIPKTISVNSKSSIRCVRKTKED